MATRSTSPVATASLVRAIVVTAGLGILGTSLVIALIATRPLYGQLKASHEERLLFTAHSQAAVFDGVAARMINIAGQVSSRTRARQLLEQYQAGALSVDAFRDGIDPILRDALDRTTGLIGITRLDATGRFATSVGHAVPADYWAPAPPVDPALIGPVEIDGAWRLLVRSPIIDRTGAQVGSDIVLFEATPIEAIVRNGGTLGSSAGLTFATMTGASVTPLFVSSAEALHVLNDDILASVAAGEDGLITSDAHTSVAAFAPVRHAPWRVVVTMDEADLAAEARALAWRIAGVAIGLSVFAAVLSMILLRPLAGRILLKTSDLEGEVLRRTEDVRDARDELAETNARLRRANEELQQFATVASHDLQEPLRAIAAHLGMLDEKCRDVIPDSARPSLAFAINGATRMRQVIVDLLDYATVDQHPLALAPTALEDVTADVLRHLAPQIEASGARISVEPLPVVLADPRQMRQLLLNLISNAITFHRERVPVVRISAESDDDGTWMIIVRDNGIGIEPQYHERIFKVFHRLHAPDEFSGTGAGLAICQRIVERHGGTISVSSVVDEGSTFRVTLPSRYASNATPSGDDATPVSMSAAAA